VDTILSLSPPTPGPLAPGQEYHATGPLSGMANGIVVKPGLHGSPTPPPNINASGGVGGNVMSGGGGGNGGRPGGKWIGRGGGMRGRGFQQQQQQQNRGFGRGTFQNHGRGGPNYQYPYPPPPQQQQQQMQTPASFSTVGRGQFPLQFRPGQPIPPQPSYPNLGYAQTAAYPGNFPPQRPVPGYSAPSQYRPPQQYPYPPPPQQHPIPQQQYPDTPQSYIPPPRSALAIPNVPFEQLYPMHGKKAAEISQTPPSVQGGGNVPGGGTHGFAPPLPSSPPPLGGISGPKVDVRIIVDDVVSPVFSFLRKILMWFRKRRWLRSMGTGGMHRCSCFV
jgi:hypothetical protein